MEMTATNHTLTGIALAAAIEHPIVLPLAFMSHFFCDALPHFGVEIEQKSFKTVLVVDMAIAASLLFTVLLLQPPFWGLMLLGGIAAASPDLMWMPGFLRFHNGQPYKLPERNLLMRFHSWIQWSQSKRGLVVEAVWLMAMFYMAVRYSL